ncbi:branched-subunit amino acid transport system permease [Mycetohabitans endofungorum]|uniref:Branched-subunit amino acid transport system permease n=1 Tax=Mycetohabitans endofungorum TaxID=417203 RepID=A0A2P5K8D8_9BURK|nr:branched-subunit amino acid transport system permease [Mycetohabitans endofungorum]
MEESVRSGRLKSVHRFAVFSASSPDGAMHAQHAHSPAECRGNYPWLFRNNINNLNKWPINGIHAYIRNRDFAAAGLCDCVSGHPLGISPWIGLVASVVITALAALTIGAIMMWLSGHFLPLGTIVWSLSLFFLLGNMELLVKYDGINGIPALELFGWILDSDRSIYYLIWMVVLATVVSVQNLLNSRPGRAIRALRGGGALAEAMGVNTT